jgi:hypothetical protein
LKGVKGDADGEYDLEAGRIGFKTHGGQHVDGRIQEETEIFEKAKQPKVAGDADGQICFSFINIIGLIYLSTGVKINNSRYPQ